MRFSLLIPVSALLFSANLVSAQADGARAARDWLFHLSGLDVDQKPLSENLLLDVGTLAPEKACFDEQEIVHFCSLDTSAVRFLSIYRDTCPPGRKLTDTGLQIIGRCFPSLEALDADANDLTSLSGLWGFPQTVRELKFIFNFGLKNADLSPVGPLRNLTSLNLQSVKLSQAALDSLTSTSLQFLNFPGDELQHLRGLAERLPALRILSMPGFRVGKADLQQLFALPDLVYAPMEMADAETKAWIRDEAEELWVDASFEKADLIQALQNRPQHRRIFLNRAIDGEEWTALLAHDVARIIMNAGAVPLLIETAKQLPTIQARELMLFRKLLFTYDEDTGEMIKHTPALLEAFAGKATRLLRWVNKPAYNWNTTTVFIDDLPRS